MNVIIMNSIKERHSFGSCLLTFCIKYLQQEAQQTNFLFFSKIIIHAFSLLFIFYIQKFKNAF